MVKKLIIVNSLIMILLINYNFCHAQWRKENEESNYCDLSGNLLPLSGVLLCPYCVGKLNVVVGDHENELVVEAKSWTARGTLHDPEADKRNIKSYLFCAFFKNNPWESGFSDEELKELFIPNEDQVFHEIEGFDTVRIKVPDHASYVIFKLNQDYSRYTSTDWLGKLLYEKCDIRPAMGELAEFHVKRPYRADKVREIEQMDGTAERRMKQQIDCPDCEGRGKIWIPEGEIACRMCGGDGYLGTVKCLRKPVGCGGTGKKFQKGWWKICTTCDGTGKIRRR